MKKEKKITGGNYLALGLYAFLGLGMEIVVLMAEQAIYGVSTTSAFSQAQYIVHWVITCIIWALFTIFLACYAKKNYGFDVLGTPQPVTAARWLIALLLVALCVATNAISWGTIKLVGEFSSKPLPMFIFQYLYYLVEVLLVLSVVIYGQKAGEMWFHSEKVPWGGILSGLTWGLAHTFTQGSIITGLHALAAGVAYGFIYLLVKKRAVYAYPLLFIAFAM